MKLKKFFAGVLAAAMMLTVGATAAFAEGGEKVSVSGNDYNGAHMFTEELPNLSLTKTLVVKNGTAPDHMEFAFEVKADGSNAAISNAAGNAVFDKTTTNDGADFVAKNDGYTATTTVNLLTVLGDNAEKVGKYDYTITEVTPVYPGVTPINSTLKMKISVVNKNGDPDGVYGYYVALYRENNGKLEKIEASDAFKNEYDSKNLTLGKKVHGSLGNLNQDFTFNIKFTKAESLKNNATTGLYKGPMVSDITGTNASIKVKGSDTAIEKNTYLALDTDYTVTLRHNGTLNLSNLPEDIKYEITENGSKAKDTGVELDVEGVKYNVVVRTGAEVSSDEVAFDAGTAIVSGTIQNSVTNYFHNTNPDSPDTGVILDNAPYIALLAIVAIGGVALMLNKRRRDEE